MKWLGYGVQRPEEVPPEAKPTPPTPVVHTPPVDPAAPVSPITRVGCMSEIPLPDQSLLRRPIEKHIPVAVDEHQPSEMVDHNGTVWKRN